LATPGPHRRPQGVSRLIVGGDKPTRVLVRRDYECGVQLSVTGAVHPAGPREKLATSLEPG